MATGPAQTPLKFTGHHQLPLRLVLSTLTGTPLRVSSIRPTSHTSTGLLPHETSLLRLLDTLTNGTHIEFSYTGTTLLYRPGLLVGSTTSTGSYDARPGVTRHELPAECSRGVSWFLLPICLLAPFAKSKLEILFTGPGCITSSTTHGDISADTVRTAILPLYAHFGIQSNIELRINKRSNPGPNGKGGGGEVHLIFGHQVRLPGTLHLLAPGRVKRIRGVAYATGVSGSSNARMIEAARGVLNPFCGDTYVFSDVGGAAYVGGEGDGGAGRAGKGERRKIGVGFGISLVVETTTDCRFSADVASGHMGGVAAEDIGRQCAFQLLESVSRGGCVSDVAAPTVLVLMAMGSEDVGRVQMGRGVLASEEVVGLARLVKVFGGREWGVRDAKDGKGEVVVSVVGKGVGNVGRKIA